jgi:PRC-barrel domain
VSSPFARADQALKSAKRSQLGRIIMKRRMLLASAATMGVVFLAAPVNAQGVQQTVPIAKVDVQTVAAGYRASKVIGSSVLNEAGETIGKIDDLLVTRDGKEPYAVLSIGGFLGLGTHMVVVRYDSLRFDSNNKIVLPGGTKEGLTMLPAFEYAKQ